MILGVASLNGAHIQAQENRTEPILEERRIEETQFPIEDPETLPLSPEESNTLFSVWDFLRMLLILGAIIGVIYIIFHFLKKAGAPRVQESQVIRILSSQPLGSGKYLHLVELGNQVYFLGAAENSVTLLSCIEDKETLDTLRLQVSQQNPAGRRNFSDLLSGMFRREEGAIPGQKNLPLSTDFLKKQRERLKKL